MPEVVRYDGKTNFSSNKTNTVRIKVHANPLYNELPEVLEYM
jgi:hypothetical protein